MSGKHCSGTTRGGQNHLGSSYSTIEAARFACEKTRACSGVWDANCDGRPPFFMCRAALKLRRSRTSCVFAKKRDPPRLTHKTSKTDCPTLDCDL